MFVSFSGMQPSEHESAFELLGVPARFDLPEGLVQRAWLAQAARLHPDRAGAAPDAAAAIARLNEAKRILDNPEERANALLARLGGPAKEEDQSLPDGFLAEMLGRREEIEAAIASGDPGARRQWDEWAARERAGYIDEMARLFREAGPSPSPESLRAIRVKLNAWRYIERLIEQLDPEYDPGKADFKG